MSWNLTGITRAFGASRSIGLRRELVVRFTDVTGASNIAPEMQTHIRPKHEPRTSRSSAFTAFRLIAKAPQQAIHRDVFIQRLPMQAAWADAHFFTLRRGGAEQPGKPRQRYSNYAAIRQRDPDTVSVKPDMCRFRRSAHAISSRLARDSPRQLRTEGEAFARRSHHCMPLQFRAAARIWLRSDPFQRECGRALVASLRWSKRRSGSHVLERLLACWKVNGSGMHPAFTRKIFVRSTNPHPEGGETANPYFTAPPTGSNRIRNRVPVALANRSSVRVSARMNPSAKGARHPSPGHRSGLPCQNRTEG